MLDQNNVILSSEELPIYDNTTLNLQQGLVVATGLCGQFCHISILVEITP